MSCSSVSPSSKRAAKSEQTRVTLLSQAQHEDKIEKKHEDLPIFFSFQKY